MAWLLLPLSQGPFGLIALKLENVADSPKGGGKSWELRFIGMIMRRKLSWQGEDNSGKNPLIRIAGRAVGKFPREQAGPER